MPVALCTARVPAGQGSHCAIPLRSAKVPFGQAVQAECEVAPELGLLKPEGHCEHCVEPSSGAYEPGVQGAQLVEALIPPKLELKVPAGQ